ncbi:MAG: AraC family transcriptional regulator, partial [Amphritea sp.]|nr:AraC family transcriptional regulator [Amphritea sp.]
IIDIADACGFVSSPHFSKCYREQMGIPPREERSVGGKGNENERVNKENKQTLVTSKPQPTAKEFVSSGAFTEAKTESSFGSIPLKDKREK